MVRDAPSLRSGAPHCDSAGRLEPSQRVWKNIIIPSPMQTTPFLNKIDFQQSFAVVETFFGVPLRRETKDTLPIPLPMAYWVIPRS